MTSSQHAEDSRRQSEALASAEPCSTEKPGETHDHVGDTAARLAGGLQQGVAAAAANTWIGRRLGRYEIRSVLGRGGMGIVYKAHDTLIERDVAIKVLPQELSGDEISLQRFLAEAKGAGKLTHPNDVAIYEIGQHEGTYYLVLEFVPCGSIADQMERASPLSVLDATRVTADACRGLAAAHTAGLVHRDIKPANLLRAADGSVKVADFGLAKAALDSTRHLTQTGSAVGTPFFMSPEQCESKPVDHRSDIYSLGATYYCMLTGTNPYETLGSIVQVMFAHCTAEVPDPRQTHPQLPLACSQIIARAMAKNPRDRYQSATEMLADLDTVIAALSVGEAQISVAGRSVRWPLEKIVAVVAFATFMVAIAGFAVFQYAVASRDAAAGGAGLPVVKAPQGPPIRVGVLHSLTGTMAESESAVVEATLLAIEELNRAGGVLGRPVEPLVRDGRSEPLVFAEQAKKLITEDHVCTVFGCWTSASRKTVLPVFERHDHLLVYPVEYEGLEESPNIIYLGATPNQQIIPAVQWAFAFQGKRRFFLVGSDYVFPRAANTIIRETLDKLGAEVAGEEYLPMGSFDVKDVVKKIVAAAPDVILNTINGDSNIAFFQELRAAGVTPEKSNTISFSIGEEELRHLNVAQMVGDYAAWSYFQSITLPENLEFVARFKAKYGPQRVLTDPMEAAYVGVKLWALAVRQAGSDNVSKIRAAFVEQHMVAPEGPVRIDPKTRNSYNTPRIGRIQPDGQFEIVWKDVKEVPPIPYPPSRTPEQWNAYLHELYRGWGDQWSAPVK